MFREPLCILDGATGTELGRRGADLSPPLWSARAIDDAPETLAQIHREYLEAGADAIIANTFRTHRRSLEKAGMGGRDGELTRRAVEIARSVRDEVNPDALVLGSVAPLEDCYRPDLTPPADACEREHAEMILNLLDGGADCVLIETMGTLVEAGGAVAAARALAPGRWMISFLTRSDGPPDALFSGEPFADLLESLHDALAVGVNCVAAPAVEAQVEVLRRLLPRRVRIGAYANTGVLDPPPEAKPPGALDTWRMTDATDPERYADYAERWSEKGATIIGGCCNTTPEHIHALAARLRRV